MFLDGQVKHKYEQEKIIVEQAKRDFNNMLTSINSREVKQNYQVCTGFAMV